MMMMITMMNQHGCVHRVEIVAVECSRSNVLHRTYSLKHTASNTPPQTHNLKHTPSNTPRLKQATLKPTTPTTQPPQTSSKHPQHTHHTLSPIPTTPLPRQRSRAIHRLPRTEQQRIKRPNSPHNPHQRRQLQTEPVASNLAGAAAGLGAGLSDHTYPATFRALHHSHFQHSTVLILHLTMHVM